MSAIFVPRVSRIRRRRRLFFSGFHRADGASRPSGLRTARRSGRGSSNRSIAGFLGRRRGWERHPRTTPGWWIRPWSSDDLAFASRGRLARRSTPPRQSQMRRGPHGRRAPNSFPVGDRRRSPCRRRVRDGSRPWAGTGASRSPPTADATTRRTMADPRTRDVPPTRFRLPPSAAPAANARGRAPE